MNWLGKIIADIVLPSYGSLNRTTFLFARPDKPIDKPIDLPIKRDDMLIIRPTQKKDLTRCVESIADE